MIIFFIVKSFYCRLIGSVIIIAYKLMGIRKGDVFMESKKKNIIASIIVLVTYLVMVTVNALANILPINGIGTGEISDSYANLFAPAGLTFAIWGVIYILLLGHSVYQLINRESLFKNEDYKWVGFWFAFSSIINTIWIFAWHYEIIWLSLILMILILVSLIIINMSLRNVHATTKEALFIKIPFAVYFGWITVATIANVTTFLVSINWNMFGISEVIWTDTMILVGAIVGFLAILYYKSFSYGLVIIWAYLGIAIKHLSSEFFDGKYVSVVIAVIVSIVIIIAGQIIMLRIRAKNRGDCNGL